MATITLPETATAATTTEPKTRRRTQLSPRAALTAAAFRVVVAVLFGCHSLVGFGFFGGVDGHGTAVPVGSWPGFYASVIELVGAIFVLAGLGTRPVAVLLSGTMAYAYFTVHAPLGLLPLLNMGEPAALYSWIFLLMAFIGPGAFAVDTLIKRRRR